MLVSWQINRTPHYFFGSDSWTALDLEACTFKYGILNKTLSAVALYSLRFVCADPIDSSGRAICVLGTLYKEWLSCKENKMKCGLENVIS